MLTLVPVVLVAAVVNQVDAAEATIVDMDAARAVSDEELAALRVHLAAVIDDAEKAAAAATDAATAAIEQAKRDAKLEAEGEAQRQLSAAQERLRQELGAEREEALEEALREERGAGQDRVAAVRREVEDLRVKLSEVCVCVCTCAWVLERSLLLLLPCLGFKKNNS